MEGERSEAIFVIIFTSTIWLTPPCSSLRLSPKTIAALARAIRRDAARSVARLRGRGDPPDHAQQCVLTREGVGLGEEVCVGRGRCHHGVAGERCPRLGSLDPVRSIIVLQSTPTQHYTGHVGGRGSRHQKNININTMTSQKKS